MGKIIFTCKTVTPLVMNGAYGDQPELRPPGIKASLRFWWRALHGHLELNQLQEQEAKIFGSTKGRSKVMIRIEEGIGTEIISQSILPHKGGSIAQTFPVDKTFKIRLECEINQKEMLKNLFILACTLGGWGKRSRRGFGSVVVTGIEINSIIDSDFNKMPESIDEIYALLPNTYFEKANNTIYSNFGRNEPYPYLKSIEIGEAFSDEFELLKSIGKSSSATKKANDDNWDYKNSMGHASGRNRLSSPVFTSIIGRNGKFLPVFTTLNTERRLPYNGIDIQNFYKNAINP